MRWIIKIILFPISLLLSILTAFLTFLLSVGTAILYLLMLMCVFVAIGSFFMLHNTRAAIEALVQKIRDINDALNIPQGIKNYGDAVGHAAR